MQTDRIPYGYCHCGCGEKTRLARASDPRHGHVKGEPMRFLKGHHHRGKIVSAETRKRLSNAMGKGPNNRCWKGANANYFRLHTRLRDANPKSGRCDECGATRRTHYALIHGREYSDRREDYRELCVACHARYDGWNKDGLSVEARAKISAAKRARDAIEQATRTHCRQGHLLSPDNVYFTTGSAGRQCRTCQRLGQRRRRAQKKAQRAGQG